MSEKYSVREWMKLVKDYQKPDVSRSFIQVFDSFVPFFGVLILAYFALQISFWLMLPLTLIGALFVVRIFIIQHDCGHYSFFKSRKANDYLGYFCSIFTITPYHVWQREHAYHHAHSGNLEHREMGDIHLMTVDEYLAASKVHKVLYRLVRQPFVSFFIVSPYYFLIKNRMTSNASWKLHMSALLTNIALILVYGGAMYLLGWKTVLLIYGLIFYFFTVMAFWFFYVQHQFEDNYWRHKEDWSPVQSALHGSSFLKLPKILQWFSGSIGFHHVHHLNSRIPNYELERCHNENPVFKDEITTLTLTNCWETMKLRFWDEEKEKMVTPRELRLHYRPRFERIQQAMLGLRKKQQALVLEASELRKKFEQHLKNNKNVEHFMQQQMMRSQLKTFQKLVKRKAARENLENYQHQLKEMKAMLSKYFPQFLRVQGE